MEEEDFELIPLSPVRRLEKRLDTLEKRGGNDETIREMLEVVRANQKVVDDIVRINSEVIGKIADLSGRINDITKKFNEFLEKVEIASENTNTEGDKEGTTTVLDERIAKLEKRLNALIASRIERPHYNIKRQPTRSLVQ